MAAAAQSHDQQVAELRAQLAALPSEERLRGTDRILAQLEALPEWQAARHVMLYAPAPGEPAIIKAGDTEGNVFFLSEGPGA